MSEQVITIQEIGPTLNLFYAGTHWAKRKKIKDTWRLLVRNAVRNSKIVPVAHYPIEVECCLVFGPKMKRYDWENCAPTAKLIQDGLIHEGILRGDGPKEITAGRLWCIRGGEARTYYRIIPCHS